MKEYYKENKDKIKEKIKKLYTCICGSELTICKKSRHEQSKKHNDFILNNHIIWNLNIIFL